MQIAGTNIPNWVLLLLLGIAGLQFLLSKAERHSVDDRYEQEIREFQSGQDDHREAIAATVEALAIQDVGLRECIEQAARDRAAIPAGNSGHIQSVRELTQLDCGRRDIRSLAGIGQMAQLNYLDISGNRLRTLDGIASLQRLKTLRADGNPLEEWRILSELDSLKNVHLPTLEQIDCADLDTALPGVKHMGSGCRKNIRGYSQPKASTQRDRSSLSDDQEQELFEYERQGY